MSLHKKMLSFLLNKNLEVGFPGFMTRTYLSETAKHFYKMILPYYIATCSTWEYLVFDIFATTHFDIFITSLMSI